MARVKRAVNALKKRRKVFKLAKGYFGAKSKQYRAAAEQVRRRRYRLHFRMGGHVGERFGEVVRPCDDAVATDNHRADGNFALALRRLRLFQGHLHEAFVLFSLFFRCHNCCFWVQNYDFLPTSR